METLDSTTTSVLICLPPVLGLLYAVSEYFWLNKIKITGHSASLLLEDGGKDVQKSVDMMKEVSQTIADGATTFLITEYKYIMVYVVLFGVLVNYVVNPATMIAFVVGSLTSILCGYIGMKTAVFCNVRTTHEAWKDLSAGFDVALRGGSVMGFALVGFGVLMLYALVYFFTQFFMPDADPKDLYEALAGYGLGGSSIALFGRVGGGIYTKAADVGADLSGKNEYGMDEDDPRNPACIADNVGDNVGDIAGMGADLFGSFAESTCAALVIAGSSGSFLINGKPNTEGLDGSFTSMMYPVLLSSTGILVGLMTLFVLKCFYSVNEFSQIEQALKGVLVISTVLETPMILLVSYVALPESFAIDPKHLHVQWYHCAASALCGLWSGLIIGYVTEYYTSNYYSPVQKIAQSQKVSAATGIIYGLAVGYMSCIVPVICLAVTVGVAHQVAGMYGVALGALGMLSTLTMGLTIDAYGPISDNAGGIAEMAELGKSVRDRTDALDAAGNTTAAIGKGFAIGSAALVSLALFAAFCVRAGVEQVNGLNPWTFTGLLYGAMMPYWFSAMTMKSVGKAAEDMVKECMEQFPKIINEGMKPEYEKCIRISTDSSVKEMIAPGCLVILSPLVAGFAFGKNCTAGLLLGALISGVQLAISMSNTGGAWDNAKKYIEAGGLGPGFKKGSQAHKNAVTGDTVGDPLKDTSGPSLNILVKLSAIMSLVFGSAIASWSNAEGGPYWMH